MRKVFISFLIIVICFVFTGAAVPKESNRLDMVKETIIPTAETVAQEETATNVEENSSSTEKTQNPEESTEIIIIEETEILSAEDKALKAEIAKISNTKIDFRAQRQDKIGTKTYASTYKELVDGKYPRIIYESKLENGENATFEYSVNSGNLTRAYVPTGISSKSENSVTFEEAQKIATAIASQYCDISVYKLAKANEWSMFYEFTFARFISGYETSEGIYMLLDFDGNVNIMTVGTNIFEDKDFTVDEAKLTAALEKYLAEATPDYTSYEIERQRISVSNGKPVMEYYLTIKSEGGGATEIAQIPIE